MLGMALVFVILLGEIDLSAGVTAGLAHGAVRRARQRQRSQLDRSRCSIALRRRRRRSARSSASSSPGSASPPSSSRWVCSSAIQGLDAHHHRQRRPLPGAGAGDPRDHEQQHAGLGRLGRCSSSSWPSRSARRSGTAPAVPAPACRTARSRWSGSSSARHRRDRRRRRRAFSARTAAPGSGRSQGVPIVVPITLVILWIGTFVLDRTKFGRYIYAVGGNAEAARRAGIKVVLHPVDGVHRLLRRSRSSPDCSASARSARWMPRPVETSC